MITARPGVNRGPPEGDGPRACALATAPAIEPCKRCADRQAPLALAAADETRAVHAAALAVCTVCHEEALLACLQSACPHRSRWPPAASSLTCMLADRRARISTCEGWSGTCEPAGRGHHLGGGRVLPRHTRVYPQGRLAGAKHDHAGRPSLGQTKTGTTSAEVEILQDNNNNATGSVP